MFDLFIMNWIVIAISVLAIVNFLVVSLVCWFRNMHGHASQWLGLMMFVVVLAMLSNVLIYMGFDCKWAYNVSIFANVSFGGMLIEFFSILRFEPIRGLKKQLILFLPSLLYSPLLIYALFDSSWIEQLFDDIRAGNTNMINAVSNMVICLYSIGANLWLIRREIKTQKLPTDTLLQLHKIRLELLTVMLVLQLFAFLPFILKLDIVYVILYMPIFGQLFYFYMVYRFFHFEWKVILPSANKILDKYAALGQTPEEVESIYNHIIDYMDERKPYLQSNFMLNDLAKELKISKVRLSMVINSKIGKSFPEYINGLRIQHSILLLQSNKLKDRTIEALAFDSGFNNRTSFYQAFRKHTGKLPKEFIKDLESGGSLSDDAKVRKR